MPCTMCHLRGSSRTATQVRFANSIQAKSPGTGSHTLDNLDDRCRDATPLPTLALVSTSLDKTRNTCSFHCKLQQVSRCPRQDLNSSLFSSQYPGLKTSLHVICPKCQNMSPLHGSCLKQVDKWGMIPCFHETDAFIDVRGLLS